MWHSNDSGQTSVLEQNRTEIDRVLLGAEPVIERNSHFSFSDVLQCGLGISFDLISKFQKMKCTQGV